LQETWVRVLSGIGGLREPGSLGPWLYRIARHAAFNHGQVRATYSRSLQDYQAGPAVNEDPARDEFENAEQVHQGLLKLSPPHREVLTLLFLENFSVQAIAQVLEIPPGTVKSRLYHAKRALRGVLAKED
jgi:RNA polymerase sigma-70 factor (ECF subfamily)